jgi:hypothetical protein
MLAVAAFAALAVTATVMPPQVPARGRQSAVVTVARPGMVRITTSGGGGTACTMVDQLRGPFASSGTAGARDCAQDLLLDAGPYQLLLDSRPKGKGQVTVSAADLGEVNAEPRRLEPGRPIEQLLPDGKQASWWLRIEKRAPVTIRVAGRTAGAVHLWRSGTWREELSPSRLETTPAPGQPIHETWIETILEPGDWLVTAYGTAPKRFTRGAESDLVTVAYGFASAERAFRALLPASGLAAYALPAGAVTAVATVEGTPAGRIRLSLHELGEAGSRLAQEEGSCSIEPRAIVAECAARSSGRAGHVLAVRGPPGAAVLVRWAPRTNLPGYVDGEYREPADRLELVPQAAGDYLVGVHDVPADHDAAPLGCALERRPEAGGPREIVAWDVPKVAAGKPLQRAFNYPRQASIWFEAPQATLLPAEIAVSTGGERRSTCALYRIQGDGVDLVAQDESGRCAITKRLSAGVYELRLRGGSEGIERVRIAEGGTGKTPDSGARGGCSFRARLAAGWRYALVTNRRGDAQARGLVARRLPVTLDVPLPVEVPAGETVRIPLDARGAVRVASPNAGPAGCHLEKGGAGTWRDGACWVDAGGADELVLAAKQEAPLVAWVGRPPVAAAPAGAVAHRPAAAELPVLVAGEPERLDFEPGQEHALVFDVVEAGLYDVGTEGLLATTCALRTPALSRLAEDRQGGRGRNCLVSAYLRPGRYLVAVRTEAPSRGRAGVVLGRRAARELPRLDAGGERFFRVEPDELVSQRLVAPKAGRYDVSGAALGAELRCRLEDSAGWPLQAVPGPCRVTVDLPKGEFVLKELPLTVESMRRNAFATTKAPVVLKGKKPHAITLWTRHRAQLGQEGNNEFRFELSAEQDVYVLLTNGMLGRIYRRGETRPIELVPPLEAAAPSPEEAAAPSPSEEQVSEEPVAEETPPEGDAAVAEGDEAPAEAAPPPPPRPPRRALPRRDAPTAPEGKKLHLGAGAYALVAEHARGDVAVSYEVQVSTDALAPGVERELAVPARLPLVVPEAGTLRLRTAGDADVRCRLFDAAGRLVAESAEVGDDWNCGLAEPLAAGTYALVIESETQLPGRTRVAVTMPAAADAGTLRDDAAYDLGTGVVSAAIAPPPSDAVVDVMLEAPEPFSCAVDDDAGRLAWRASGVRRCDAAVAAAGKTWRLRAWTLDRPTRAKARVTVRPLSPLERGRIEEGRAARVRVEKPGRYRTGEGVRCLAGASAGLLVPCGPEVSLDAGDVLLVPGPDGKVALEDVPADLDAGLDQVLPLDRAPRIERQRSKRTAVHLVEVRAPAGKRGAPACAVDGGVRSLDDGACFAASGAVTSSVVRLRADAPLEARVRRSAAALPSAARLAPGTHRIEVPEGGGLYRLPDGPARADVVLPPGAWAVLLGGGAALDLCPPSEALHACRLDAPRAAELVLLAPGERRAEATVVALPSAPVARELAGLQEETFALPGSARWRVAPAAVERRLAIDGATRCAVALDDGTRLVACDTTIPVGAGADVRADHPGGPVRAVVWSAAEPFGRLGRPLPSSTPRALPQGEAARLQGDLADLGIELSTEAVVHVRVDSGSCALVANGALAARDDLGGGCRLSRLLPAGRHRLIVRAFAGAPLSGAAAWTADPVEVLAEGAGPEGWIGPGEARMFRFRVASRGQVGLGLREEAEALDCRVTDATGRVLGTGCQQLLAVEAGDHVLAVSAPPGVPPMRFRPVLVGLAGSEVGIPPEYLRDLLERIGGRP